MSEKNDCDCSKKIMWYDWIILICVYIGVIILMDLCGIGERVAYEKYRKGEIEPIIKKIKYPNDPVKCDTVYKFIEH